MTGARPVDAAVIGAGSWGTALAHLLSRNGHRVRLWSYEREVEVELREARENRSYLPGIRIPEAVEVSGELEAVLPGAEFVVSVSPAQFVGEVMGEAARYIHPGAIVVSASKGIETHSLRRMNEVLRAVLAPAASERLAALSGPSFAAEVAAGQPTAVPVGTRLAADNVYDVEANSGQLSLAVTTASKEQRPKNGRGFPLGELDSLDRTQASRPAVPDAPTWT